MRFILVLFLLFNIISCTSKTSFGDCVGIDDEKDPALNYDISTANVVWGIIFIELFVPPIIVVLDQLYCPISKKENL